MDYHITTPPDEPHGNIIHYLDSIATERIKKYIFITSGIKSRSKEDVKVAIDNLMKDAPESDMTDAMIGLTYNIIKEHQKDRENNRPVQLTIPGIVSISASWEVLN